MDPHRANALSVHSNYRRCSANNDAWLAQNNRRTTTPGSYPQIPTPSEIRRIW
jgi:hypothetical protein